MQHSARYRKVLLLSPSYKGSFYEEPAPNPAIGLGYISESLKRSDIEHRIIDMTLGYSILDVIEFIKRERSDLIGVSMMSFGYKEVYRMLSDIKEKCPFVDCVVGGAHMSSWRAKVLRECKAIDVGVVGEGEAALVELCEGKARSEIQGIVYRDGSHVRVNEARSYCEHLDKLAFPRYEAFEIEKYEKIGISTSRGCPYRCIYCQSHLTLGRTWRSRSAQSVADEIAFWYQKGRKDFSIVEDNFTYSRKRVKDICGELKTRQVEGLRIELSGIRADRVDYQLLKEMKEIGFRSCAFGVESGNDRILGLLRKGERIQTIEESIKAACDLGYEVKLYFIIGSPYETWEDFKDSIRVAETYPVNSVNFYSMMPIPETELFDWVKGNGTLLRPLELYLNKNTPWSMEAFFDGPGMSLKEKRKALQLGLKVRRKIWARNAIRQVLGVKAVKLVDVLHEWSWSYKVIYEAKSVKRLLKMLYKQIHLKLA